MPVCTVLSGECNSDLFSRESFWPEQQCWVETAEPTAGTTVTVCL